MNLNARTPKAGAPVAQPKCCRVDLSYACYTQIQALASLDLGRCLGLLSTCRHFRVQTALGPRALSCLSPTHPASHNTLPPHAPVSSLPLSLPQNAPAVREDGLPEGNQWRYSEFINAVNSGKVERVRFSKDGTMLQLTAIDGRRATVVLPNDPDLVDILAKNGVDISVSEGDQQGNYVALLGNILFPLIAFGGLFFLFRRAQVRRGCCWNYSDGCVDFG